MNNTNRGRLVAAVRQPTHAALPLLVILLLALWALIGSHQLRASDPIPVVQAIDEMLSRLDESPSADGYNDLGNLYDLAGDLTRAEAAYRQALEWDADHTDALYNLGLVLQRHRRWKEAGRFFERVIDQEPAAAWAHFQLGMSRHERGNQRGAVRAFVTAFELDASLAFPDVNPQLLDNDSATIALLQRSSSATGDSAPRRYAQPTRTASLLIGREPAVDEPVVGEPGEEPEEQTEEESRDSSMSQVTRRGSSGTSEGVVTGESMPDDPDTTERVFSERSYDLSQDERDDEATSGSEDRVIGASSLRGTTGRPTGSSTPAARPAPSSTRDGRSVARPSSNRFRPGRRSNARIEWELSPLPATGGAIEAAAAPAP